MYQKSKSSRIQSLSKLHYHTAAYWFNHWDGVHVPKKGGLNGHAWSESVYLRLFERSLPFGVLVKISDTGFLSVHAYKFCDKSSTQFFFEH